jgi:hypothetical protein
VNGQFAKLQTPSRGPLPTHYVTFCRNRNIQFSSHLLTIEQLRHCTCKRNIEARSRNHCYLVCLFVSMAVRGKPRMYLSLAGFLYRPLWTFQLWPPDASAPTDASGTLAAEVGTLWAGNEDRQFSLKCRLPRYILGIFYMPQICDMGPTALLPFRRKAC